MTLSQAIAALTKIKNEHGDLELVSLGAEGGDWAIEIDRVFDVIEIPDDENADDIQWQKVCAFMEEVGDDGQPKQHLRVVQ